MLMPHPGAHGARGWLRGVQLVTAASQAARLDQVVDYDADPRRGVSAGALVAERLRRLHDERVARNPKLALRLVERREGDLLGRNQLNSAGIFTLGTIASDFMIASVLLLSPQNQTITAGLGTFDVALDELAAVAGVNLLAIPVVTISAVFARGFVRGLTASMVEGS